MIGANDGVRRERRPAEREIRWLPTLSLIVGIFVVLPILGQTPLPETGGNESTEATRTEPRPAWRRFHNAEGPILELVSRDSQGNPTSVTHFDFDSDGRPLASRNSFGATTDYTFPEGGLVRVELQRNVAGECARLLRYTYHESGDLQLFERDSDCDGSIDYSRVEDHEPVYHGCCDRFRFVP